MNVVMCASLNEDRQIKMERFFAEHQCSALTWLRLSRSGGSLVSQFNTDEILRIMEKWYQEQKANGISTDYPFEGFDRLLGADLKPCSSSSRRSRW